jgi:hypothetical protein
MCRNAVGSRSQRRRPSHPDPGSAWHSNLAGLRVLEAHQLNCRVHRLATHQRPREHVYLLDTLPEGRLRVIGTVEDPLAVRHILAAQQLAQPLGPGLPGGAFAMAT